MNAGVSTERIDRVIVELDSRIASVVDAVLHHPAFQALEAAWRGLAFVVDRVVFDENIEVAVWSCSKSELQTDFADAVDVIGSRVFRTVYTAEYGQFGGLPYGALFIDAAFSASHPDVATLRRLAAVGAMAHAPVFVAADPTLLRLRDFSELPMMTNPAAVFEEQAALRWNRFRKTDDSRYVGVLLPRILLRQPYREVDESATSFVYDERLDKSADYLWGSPVYAFAVRIADSFARFRTYTGMLGTFDDRPPALDAHRALGRECAKPPVEVMLSRRLEQSLTELGFIPLTCDPIRSTLRFTSASSLQSPRAFGTSEGGQHATLSFLLGTRVPYLLLACRFAHYIKVLERDRVGSHRTRDEIEHELNAWLSQYVVVLDSASAATRLKYPLRNARVKVNEVEGNAEFYRIDVLVQPHLKYLRQAFTLSVSGRIEVR
jgi:type VI secretion system protein ImpC